VSGDRELCIWTVTPGANNSFNGIKFTLISEEFDEEDNENFVSIAYATQEGGIIEKKRL
jgi:hypothetical protein